MDVYNFPPSFKAPLDGRTQKEAYDKKDLNQERKKVREAFLAMTQAMPPTSKAPRKRILSTKKPLHAAKITAAQTITRKRKADSDMPTSEAKKADFVSNEPENRGVFLYTNELGWQQVLEQLQKLPACGNVGIGVSALYNLELFLARAEQGVNYWMIIDPAPEVQAFWRVVIEAFTVSQNLDDVFGFVHNTMVLNERPFSQLSSCKIMVGPTKIFLTSFVTSSKTVKKELKAAGILTLTC